MKAIAALVLMNMVVMKLLLVAVLKKKIVIMTQMPHTMMGLVLLIYQSLEGYRMAMIVMMNAEDSP